MPSPSVRPVKVLHVTQPVEAGTANVVRNLIRFDLDHGREVVVGCPASGLSEWVRDQGAHARDVPMSRSLRAGDLRALLVLRKALERSDVAVLHSSKAGALGRLATLSLRKSRRPRIVFYPHGWSWLVPGRASALYRRIERMLAPVADRIVAVSHYEAQLGQSVLSRRGVGQLSVIPNGVDCDAFSPDGPSGDVSSSPIVVCVGRLCEQKGQDLLIAALADERLDGVTLVLVGDGPSRDSLQAQAEVLGVAARVEFVGFADPRPFYRAADVVVLPSRWEGFSLVMLEAMACGANIAASVSAAADFNEDHGVRILHDLSPNAISAQLVEMLNDDASAQGHRDTARGHVVDSYSWSTVLLGYEELMTELGDRSR